MRKGPSEAPRMLPFVVQAVTDLKDMNGSTMRKILDQVHTAINITNVKPKPRNVVMQVKRALKHAVDSGVLKHKAGKYRLILETKPIKQNSGLKTRTRRAVSRRRQRRQRKGKKLKKLRHRKRNAVLKRYSSSPTSDASKSDQSTDVDAYDKKSRNKRRRRRSLAKKTVQFRRCEKKATRKKGRTRRVRQPTPMPVQSARRRGRQPEVKPEAMDVKTDEIIDESPEIANQIQNLENVFANKCLNEEGGDVDQSVDNEMERIIEMPPECDNPDCLCNLKQEPSEDGNDDECNNGEFYQ